MTTASGRGWRTRREIFRENSRQKTRITALRKYDSKNDSENDSENDAGPGNDDPDSKKDSQTGNKENNKEENKEKNSERNARRQRPSGRQDEGGNKDSDRRNGDEKNDEKNGEKNTHEKSVRKLKKIENLNRQWKETSERMEAELLASGKEASQDRGSLDRILSISNRRRTDYREFLRKFAILREVTTIDPDSFDYGFIITDLRFTGTCL